MLTRAMTNSLKTLIVVAAAAGTLAAAGSAQAATRTDRVCQTQPAGPFNVYQVCLTGNSSYNGRSAGGYVSGVYCNIFYPTGAGFFCDPGIGSSGRRWGAYYNSNLGAWEEWLNQRVNYISPFILYRVHFSNCVYLRIDVRPNGYTTYQNFAVKNRGYLAAC